ncbi:MAG: AAA domain-containing protein [Bacteroidota bacterium]
MSENHLYRIEDFISELTTVTFSDILVNVNEESRTVLSLDSVEEKFELPFSSKINQIYKIASQYKKNSDVQSLCLVSHLFSWSYKNRDLKTPLFLIPLHCKVNKIKQIFEFTYDESQVFLNPFLQNTLKKEFDIDLNLSSENELFESLDFIKKTVNEKEFLCEFIDFSALGNFHHHRYEIVKDLEEILASKNENDLVKILLGNSESKVLSKINLSPKNCFETDTNQAEVFKLLESSNLVVQGPPGTGKSQVLANLLSKLLLGDENHLLVSEKKTALEVLIKKLEKFDLQHFAFVFHSQTKAGDFIKQLKNSWNFLENTELKEERNLLLSSQYKQQIQLIFDKLNQTSYFGNRSLFELQSLMSHKEVLDLPYISSLPDLNEFEGCKNDLAKLYENLKNIRVISFVNSGIYQNIENFDKILDEVITNFSKLSKQFEIQTISDLEILNKKTIRFQLLENESNKKYLSLVNSKSALQKFKKLKEKYQAQTILLELSLREILIWKIVPSLTELESWTKILEEGSWFKKRRLKAQIQEQLTQKNIDLTFALKNLKTYLEHLQERTNTEIELLALGIEKPEIELNVIDYVVSQLSAISVNELNEISKLSAKEKQLFSENIELIQTTNRSLKSYFTFSEETLILESLEALKVELPKMIELKESLLSLPNAILSKLQHGNSLEDFELLVLKSSWIKFSSNFPELASFTGEKLKSQLQKIIALEKEEQKSFAREICFKRQEKFKEFQDLLSVPAAKLSEEKKNLKKNLKLGKAILVKEFSKSKQHKSIRELLETEAKIWIDLLCPLHLSTPIVVSKNYPLTQNLFEFVIFDEASQLVLPKAISCVQRGKRLLIAGDSQQMSPSSFFAGKISSVDLLHQASYYLPNVSLKHHYRSVHAELIQFSNKHFYKNELIVYPSPNKNEFPLEFHYVENGIFENRENELEAQQVVTFIEKNISSTRTIGVVAFSEQQLSCIWKKINVKYYALLEEKIKTNQIFFKSLEQVQGEECDHLIISLAYGRDLAGKFHLRFGPLNQENGSKRLNVLFTRAKEKIDFFSSVLSSDFELSTNESINLLRNYLQNIESQDNKSIKEFVFPYDLKPQIEAKNLKIKEVHTFLSNSEDLKTFQEVMESRDWMIEYEL